jgi:glycosyltransferase involved in cell wall biosynthesis
MRIIQTVASISEEAAGPSYSVVRLCETLIADGEDTTLAVLDWTPMPSPPRFVKMFPLGAGPRRLGRSPSMRQWFAEAGRSQSVDLIHNHGLWMMPNVYSGSAARRFKIPFVVSPRGTLSDWAFSHGSPAKRLFWPLLQRPALATVSCFHATSEAEYEAVRRRGFRQPVAVIPNGIDIPTLVPKQFPSCRTLLFLGRLHPSKGLELLLPAWRAVQDRFPEWRLVIAGPDQDGYGLKMRNMADELGLKRIEFAGALMGDDKWAAYQAADLFVLPSYTENFGMTVAEALASGVPAIVSKGAPWKEIEDKKAGWWIEIGVDPLVGCLEHALSQSSDVLGVMGRRGRNWMEEEFSWTRAASEMQEVYRWILHGGRKPHCVLEN